VKKKSETKPKFRIVHKDSKKEVQALTAEERAYFRSLHKMVDEIYQEAHAKNWTWNELAVRAKLDKTTVVRLGLRVTKLPRFFTIHKLAKAVGWNIVTESKKVLKIKVG
jgi:hypothetical protein